MYSETVAKLFTQLNTNANITSLVDKHETQNMIVNDDLLPADWENTKSTINFYRSLTDDFSKYDDDTYICNCRAYLRADSIAIAEMIKSELHEKTLDGFMFVVTFTGTIRPSDETDNYNTVININVRQK